MYFVELMLKQFSLHPLLIMEDHPTRKTVENQRKHQPGKNRLVVLELLILFVSEKCEETAALSVSFPDSEKRQQRVVAVSGSDKMQRCDCERHRMTLHAEEMRSNNPKEDAKKD